MARRWKFLKPFSEGQLKWLMQKIGPREISHITGIKSTTGAETEGWFIAVPLTPQMFMNHPIEEVYRVMAKAVNIGKKLGADVVGLGAFTSVVGDGGITVQEMTGVPITTGNSYTVATAIEGALDACDRVGIERKSSTLAVIGATGSIGHACAVIMAPEFKRTILIGRDQAKTQEVANEIPGAEASTDIELVRQADVVVTVTSSDAAILLPEHLKPGAVVCDVARPRDVSVRVTAERPDVLVIEGGVIEVPGNVEFGFDFGFPDRTAYACMSETIMLALEDRPESFTLGKHVSADQVREIQQIAQRHGFKLAGYRNFEKAVTDDQIKRVRAARLQHMSTVGG